MVVLSVDSLDFSYPQHPLFTDFSVGIPSGVTLVRGGDGSGKTTLLRLLAGELQAQAGDLQIKGVSQRGASLAYRQQVFWIDPCSLQHDQITALQFFDLQREQYPDFLPKDAPQLAALIAGLSLAEHIAKPLYMLSTGSKRKVWLAAAFAAGATLTLLDDPFAALDKPSIRFVVQQLAAAANHPARAWVFAYFDRPAGVPLARVIELCD